MLNRSKYTLYLRFFKVSTICLDSFAHSWHSLNQLHLEWFPNSLERVPTYAEHLLAAYPSLCGPTHPKPSQLGWGWVIVEARSSDAALHHSPWSKSPYTAWRWWSCWLNVPWILNNSVSPTKHPHTITSPPLGFTVRTTHAEIIGSPILCLTMTQRLEPKI